MKFLVCKDYDEMSVKASEIMAEVIASKGDALLGLATGSTPVGMYKELIKLQKEGKISFKDVKSVNLDEYYPINPENENSYRYFMNENLFDHIDIDKNNTYVLNGLADDPEKECEKFEEIIDSLGQVDIQVLGIGRNGHIAFNEPDAKLYEKTHVTGLTQSTIDANARFFDSIEDVPTKALTMGIGTILKAKKIIILAGGKEKSEAVSALKDGFIDPMCPATMLKVHPDVTVICDEAAWNN